MVTPLSWVHLNKSPHKRNACPQLAGFKRCNNCGKEGHFKRDCATLANTVTRTPVLAPAKNQQRMGGNRPQASSRVYALTGGEATGLGNLVIGHCMIAGKSCRVLYDFGATHSFVSDACVKRLGLSVGELYCELELEVILGMDWLFANHILIDFRGKKLLFPDSEEPELLTSQGVVKELQEGAQCYIIFTHLEV
ncbi:uncharacterized protein LOC114194923 [Vigna unguiculata]|uniref:uncharacterized protein LOC114194923 n=1 Tax=Vigna unguiculata TaxID=3917 RepID=UPI001016E541|nr:uncharacterized protein LOC114194923 [Vigna unguiculata]